MNGKVRMECEFNQYVKEYIIYNAVDEEVFRTHNRKAAFEVFINVLNGI